MTTRRRFLQALAALPPALRMELSQAATPDASRLALVVGNTAYRQAPLLNPENDARGMSKLLGEAGVRCETKINATRAELMAAIDRFGNEVKRSDAKLAIFYYAGHGVQLDWRNYLLPVDAVVERADQIKSRCVDLGALLGHFGATKDKTFIVILDACRNNPFGSSWRPAQKGLSQFDAPPGSLLAYATAPGNVAADGSGSNGLYTEHLLRELAKRDTRIEDALKRVRLNVRLASHGEQVPWETTSLESDVFIFPEAAKKLSEKELEAQLEADITAWNDIKSSQKQEDWINYLRRFPNGRFAEIAQMRLTRLLAETEKRAIEERRREEQRRIEQERQEMERLAAEQRQREEKERQERERLRLAEEQRLAAEMRRQQEEQLRLEREQARLAEERRLAAERQQRTEQERERARLAEQQRQAAERAQREERERLERERVRLVEEQRKLAEQQRQEAERQDRERRRLAEEREREERRRAEAARVASEQANRTPAPAPSRPPAAGLPAIEVGAGLPVPQLIPPSANPYSAGRYPLGRIFTIGDTATVRQTDLLTGIEENVRSATVTKVDYDNDRVEFNDGLLIADLMGNSVKNGSVLFDTPVQYVPAEFQVGKKWTAAFRRTQNGQTTSAYYDLQIVKRETISVPAGTFDTFRIEGEGWNQTLGSRLEVKFWLVPGIIFTIRREFVTRNRFGRFVQTERHELVSMRQQAIGALS